MIKIYRALALAAWVGLLTMPLYAQRSPTPKEFLKTVRETDELLIVDGERIYRGTEVAKKATITLKPEPQFTDKARKKKTQGLVELLVIFKSNGEVKVLYELKRLAHGLTEEAVKAATRIQFTPATLDGEPVSQIILLQYSFNRM